MEQNNNDLDRRLSAIEERLRRLEGFLQGPRPPSPPPPRPTAKPRTPPKATAQPRERDFGKLIAWAGGLAFTTGIVLLVSLAVERGWIGPAVRFGLGLSLALSATGISVYLSTDRRLYKGLADDPASRISVGRTLFVVGLVGGFAASYAGYARWDLFGLATLSVLIAALTFIHLAIGHVSGDIVRAGSAIAGAFLVPVYAGDLASVRLQAWPALVLFAGAAFLSMVWSGRSASVTGWILGTVGGAALFEAIDGSVGAPRILGIWTMAIAAGGVVFMVDRRLAHEDAEFSILDAVLVGWLALMAGLFLGGRIFGSSDVVPELSVILALVAGAIAALRSRRLEIADGLGSAALLLALVSVEHLSDHGLVWMSAAAAVLVAASVWVVAQASLPVARFVSRSLGVVLGFVTALLVAFPILDDRAEVVLSGGLMLLAFVVAAIHDRDRIGRWVFGSVSFVVWVAWWAGFSGLTFQPDAVTTAGWFTTAIAAMYLGRRYRIRAIPIAGLVLGGVAYLKLFMYDLSAVDPGVRIILFLVVGAALVAFALRLGRRESTKPGPTTP